MKHAATWEREIAWLEQGYHSIAGVDEVGRGAWAGPLVAGAYIFHTIPSAIEVYDSKQLSEMQRLKVREALVSLGACGLGIVTEEEIDRLGLQNAQYLAYERALEQLPLAPDIVLIDGRHSPGWSIRHEAIVRGDATVASIAAASILAKIYRDTYMKEVVSPLYPLYGFADHVGYGTAAHRAAIKRFGIVSVHRQSYKPIRELNGKE